MTGNDWRGELARLAGAATPHVMVTVIEAAGSVPREAGTKMIVTATGQYATIGGGNLEYKATAMARRLLRDGATAPSVEQFPLGPALGQCCGGHVALLFEPFGAAGLHIVLFGAGHVGRAVAHMLGALDCRVTWIDPRPDPFPAAITANITAEVSDAPVYDVAEAPAGASFLVMTQSHSLDRDLVEAILRRGDSAYCGLIGSATKRARFEARLRAKGLGDADFARLTCPIGIAGIAGKHPGEIAAATLAQLLQVHEDAATAPTPPEIAAAD